MLTEKHLFNYPPSPQGAVFRTALGLLIYGATDVHASRSQVQNTLEIVGFRPQWLPVSANSPSQPERIRDHEPTVQASGSIFIFWLAGALIPRLSSL